MFFEYTEWVYVYNKYKLKKDDRYNYYLNKCYEVINKRNLSYRKLRKTIKNNEYERLDEETKLKLINKSL